MADGLADKGSEERAGDAEHGGRMKPLGLLGPGESSRAMMPATKPTMMIQMMPPMTVVLPQNA
jgi:hypothetical protein